MSTSHWSPQASGRASVMLHLRSVTLEGKQPDSVRSRKDTHIRRLWVRGQQPILSHTLRAHAVTSPNLQRLFQFLPFNLSFQSVFTLMIFGAYIVVYLVMFLSCSGHHVQLTCKSSSIWNRRVLMKINCLQWRIQHLHLLSFQQAFYCFSNLIYFTFLHETQFIWMWANDGINNDVHTPWNYTMT